VSSYVGSHLKFQILEVGHTEHWESISLSGAPHQKIRFPATVAVFDHPRFGIVLFDTGYSPRFFDQTKYFPEKFYAMITPVHIAPEQTAVSQLKQLGISTRDVRAIILSHFHADHIAGLSDFPQATYVYRASAYEDIKNRSRWGQVKSGFIKGLLPGDFTSRSKQLTEADFKSMGLNLTGFDRACDYFGDESLFIIDLPGHAAGHIGIYAETHKGKVLLVADACWSHQSVIENRLPSRIASFLFSDWKKYAESLSRLNSVYQSFSEIKIFPCHCQKSLDEFQTVNENENHQDLSQALSQVRPSLPDTTDKSVIESEL
jgi:glyoxylase-like metal-dependent hydrolase (beta-lactamase superfamily II)